jgi:serine/threonine-protein kinase PknG
MADASVPVAKRFCPSCDAKLNLEKGFCPMCGTEYSFVPTLKAGDIIAGQYEVRGAVAYGGLGWIYLGWDQTLNRWVVLKGLLNSKDPAGAAMAVAERQYLAAVKHPNIVGIYNFVTQGSEGFIVMEYVGGKTVKEIRKERGPLPVPEAIAYIHRILLAFGYLHRMGLVYCDFKPDNFMVEEDDVKLIDMGGVRRLDDLGGDIYGTKGYSAPEATDSPSIPSDLYTVARTLTVLIMDFKFTSTYEFSLPKPEEQALFQKYDSLYLWLLRATQTDPDDRFQTADEMAEQLLGVLREIVAADTGTARPADSTIFLPASSDSQIPIDSIDYRLLPGLRVDPFDQAANAILSAGTSTPEIRLKAYELAAKKFPESVEAQLRAAEIRIGMGSYTEADVILAAVEKHDPFEWRVSWYRGCARLAAKRGKEAAQAFDRVVAELPGELAPKLAVAMAAELSGDFQRAARYYDTVSRTDPGISVAVFGLARCLRQMRNRAGAASAYTRIPNTSSRYIEAQMLMARTLFHPDSGDPAEQDLLQASAALQALQIDSRELHELAAELLLAAVTQVEAKRLSSAGSGTILGQPMDSTSLRFGVERELRACARFARTPDERIDLVDRANRERPRTLV